MSDVICLNGHITPNPTKIMTCRICGSTVKLHKDEDPPPQVFFQQPIPETLLTIHGPHNGDPIIKIMSDGRIFWKGKEIQNEKEFVEVVTIIVKRMFGGPYA